MRIKHNGNIGINETDPYYRLHMVFTNTDTSLSGGGSGNWGSDGIRIENTSTTVGSMSLAHFRNYSADWHIGSKYKSSDNSDFVFMAESDEKLRITSAGLIGAGTDIVDDTPLNALHILDSVTSIWNNTITKTSAVLRLETHYNAQETRAAGDYGSGIVFNNLGGHSSNNGQHADNIHAWLGLRVIDTPAHERSALVFATNNETSTSNHDTGCTERMVIMPDGNIGINETDPDAKLEVNVGSGTTAFEVRGSEGQLFSVTNSLSSGSIFSVNDISGVPSIDVDADGTIELAPFGGTVDVGGNLTVDAGTNTTITVKCDDTGAAGIRLYGDSQGTGYVEVGQSQHLWRRHVL